MGDGPYTMTEERGDRGTWRVTRSYGNSGWVVAVAVYTDKDIAQSAADFLNSLNFYHVE